MQSFYDFQGQINALGHIFSESVSLAQNINVYLQKMPKSMVSKIVKELKEQYEKLYNDLDDEQKLNAIKNTLNLAARQQVTNLDSLSIELADEINSYYKKQYFKLKKEKPFMLSCEICSEKVANDHYGCQMHKSKCRKKKQHSLVLAPQRKNQKKMADTIQKYEKRQNLVNESLKQQRAQKISEEKEISSEFVENQKKKQKLSNLKRQKIQKEHKISKKYLKSLSSNLSKHLLPKFKEKSFESFDQDLSEYFSQNQHEHFQYDKNSSHHNLQHLFEQSKDLQDKYDNDFGRLSFNRSQMKFREQIYRENDDEFFEDT